MGVSAICASATDLAFDLNGYLWQLVNCMFTAGYSLYLRGVMDKASSSLSLPKNAQNRQSVSSPIPQPLLILSLLLS